MTDEERAREICANLADPETDIKTIAAAFGAVREAERARCLRLLHRGAIALEAAYEEFKEERDQ